MQNLIDRKQCSSEEAAQFILRLKTGDFSRQVLLGAMEWRGEEQKRLFAYAREKRAEYFPAQEVEARSVIEISNVCLQGCHYCSMAKGSGIKRYAMKPQAVIDMADFLYERGRRVVLLQSGENSSETWLTSVANTVAKMKANHPDQEIILCLGNFTREQFIKLKNAGADRYILKFESSSKHLYETWKPTDTIEERTRCLKDLVEIGFKTGSGNIVGMPGQSVEDMVDDLIFMGQFDLTMNSCTVFIPGESCGYKDQPMGDVDYALNSMALMRIMYPHRLMPTTSCLEKCRKGGQYEGLMAGANTITIHDGTPENYKSMFPIYSTNRFTPDNNHLLDAVTNANLEISTNPLQ
jgi:biotin synthase